MSHITELKTKYRDLGTLKAAVENKGGVFVEGKKTHATYGRFVGDSAEGAQFVRERGTAAIGQCEHAIRLKDHNAGDYEVGVVRSLDGDGYNLVYDSWGPGKRLEAAFGKDMKGIRHEYAVETSRKRTQAELGRLGWSVGQREDLGDGRTRLRVRKR